MMSVFSNKRILLGVTGSIAAYKAADLASKLAQAGAQVDVILTEAAQKFIAPLTFQSVTGRRAYADADLWGDEAHVLHVGLGHTADLLVIAPCTANTLAKLARGQADSLLTVTALASNSPLLLAPAMDGGMYDHPATQENLDTLRKRGARIIEPAEGHLASGLTGKGRLPETNELIGHIRLLLGRDGRLAQRNVIVTAGGTQEPLDPVRVLTNHSSGKQGYAIAQAAVDAGAQVTLITAPSALKPPVGARVIQTQTARQMLDAVLQEYREPRAHHGGGSGRLPPENLGKRQDQKGRRRAADRTRGDGRHPESRIQPQWRKDAPAGGGRLRGRVARPVGKRVK